MNLRSLFRSFFKKGQNSLIKIVSLGVGLAVGLVLIAKVYFEQSYDDFYPDADRIYMLRSNYMRHDSEKKELGTVSGAVAPGMKAEIPEVELATRYTVFVDDGTFYTADRKKYNGTFILADTCLFDVLPRPVLAGDPKDILSRPMYAMVSRKIAVRMGGVANAVGKTIELDSHPDKPVTIGGVFEDLPENSHASYNVIVSMSSISRFTYDGTENWLGNDRYSGYVKLVRGTDPESLAPAIRKMQEKYQPVDELEKAGTKLGYSLIPLRDVHSGMPEAKSMSRLLALLAFVILFTAVMNYILVVISSLVRRSKEMAVNRCFGASGRDIYVRMLSEAFVHLAVSLLVSLLLVLAFREVVAELLDASVGALFSPGCILVLLGICLVVFFVSGLVPGYLFSQVPISSAFRKNTDSRRFWKLGLLFLQFMATGFLVTLLVVIVRQYEFMITDSPGYAYENLSYCSLSGVDAGSRKKAIDEISGMPEVAAVSSCSELLLSRPSGNNIYLPDDDRELFNIADLYFVGDGYLKLMEIPVVEGRSFLEGVVSSDEVMVSRSFVKKMQQYTDWNDGAIGKAIFISEHSRSANQLFTICGVYEDFRINAIGVDVEVRPTVMFYQSVPSGNLLVKYHRQTAEANRQVAKRLESLLPDKDIVVNSYATDIVSLYSDSRKFRNSVMIGGIVAFVISLIGLIGYTSDEMSRRRKETAIRKVSGATIPEVLKLFLKDIVRIALPALVLAGGIAAFVSAKWQEQFIDKVPLSFALFIVCGIAVLVIIQSVVSLNCYQAATENPAESIKTE